MSTDELESKGVCVMITDEDFRLLQMCKEAIKVWKDYNEKNPYDDFRFGIHPKMSLGRTLCKFMDES